MKITDVNVYVMNTKLNDIFSFSQGPVYNRCSVLVRIDIDNGVYGWGECMCHGQQAAEISAAAIEFMYKPLIIGENPFDVGVIWERLYNRTRPFGQAGSVINALSGIDIALYDCLGKIVGQPVYNLLGGRYRDKVKAYATGFYWADDDVFPDCWIEEAKRHLAKGFRGMKLKTGRGVEEDIRNVNTVRSILPEGTLLMADFNSCYSYGEAKRVIDGTRDARLYFYEELLSPEDLDGYCRIRNYTSSNIAGGEEILTKHIYLNWMKAGALDIYQPDICSAGGFTEGKKILSIAEATNNRVIPHVWGSAVGLAASLQFIAAVPRSPLATRNEEPMLEFDQSTHPFRALLIKEEIGLDDEGYVHISDRPGIGVTVDMDVVREFGKKLTYMSV